MHAIRLTATAALALALALVACDSPTSSLPKSTLGSTAFDQALEAISRPEVWVQAGVSLRRDMIVLMFQTYQPSRNEICREGKVFLVVLSPKEGLVRSDFAFKGGDGTERPSVDDLRGRDRQEVLQLLGVIDDPTVRLVQAAHVTNWSTYYPTTGVGKVEFSASVGLSKALVTLNSVACKG